MLILELPKQNNIIFSIEMYKMGHLDLGSTEELISAAFPEHSD